MDFLKNSENEDWKFLAIEKILKNYPKTLLYSQLSNKYNSTLMNIIDSLNDIIDIEYPNAYDLLREDEGEEDTFFRLVVI